MEDPRFSQASALLVTKVPHSYLVAQIHSQVHNIYLYSFHSECLPINLQRQLFSVSTFLCYLFATFAAMADGAFYFIMTVQMQIQTQGLTLFGQENEATRAGPRPSVCPQRPALAMIFTVKKR